MIKFKGYSDDIVYVVVDGEVQDEYYPDLDGDHHFVISDTERNIAEIKPVFGERGYGWSWEIYPLVPEFTLTRCSIVFEDEEEEDQILYIQSEPGTTVTPSWKDN